MKQTKKQIRENKAREKQRENSTVFSIGGKSTKPAKLVTDENAELDLTIEEGTDEAQREATKDE